MLKKKVVRKPVVKPVPKVAPIQKYTVPSTGIVAKDPVVKG